MPLIQLLEVLVVVGVFAVAGQSLHSNAGVHQVNSEWRGGHRRGSVAAECFWSLSFTFTDPRWIVKHDIAEGHPARLERTNTRSRQRSTADICHKEML
jgi:hypothetical protein